MTYSEKILEYGLDLIAPTTKGYVAGFPSLPSRSLLRRNKLFDTIVELKRFVPPGVSRDAASCESFHCRQERRLALIGEAAAWWRRHNVMPSPNRMPPQARRRPANLNLNSRRARRHEADYHRQPLSRHRQLSRRRMRRGRQRRREAGLPRCLHDARAPQLPRRPRPHSAVGHREIVLCRREVVCGTDGFQRERSACPCGYVERGACSGTVPVDNL